ncbi:MAG: hypothetical protein ACE5FF_04130, partial [Saprospiraceae bacterium]
KRFWNCNIVINLEVHKNCLLKKRGFAKSSRKMFIIAERRAIFRLYGKVACKLSIIYHHVKKITDFNREREPACP